MLTVRSLVVSRPNEAKMGHKIRCQMMHHGLWLLLVINILCPSEMRSRDGEISKRNLGEKTPQSRGEAKYLRDLASPSPPVNALHGIQHS